MIEGLDTLIDDYLQSTEKVYIDAWAIGSDVWTEEMSTSFYELRDQIKKSRGWVSSSIDKQRDEEEGVWQDILDWLSGAGEVAGGLFASIPPMITDFTIPGLEDLGELFSGAWAILAETVNSMLEGMAEALQPAVDALGEMIGDSLDWLTELLWSKLAEALEP